jgi:hypothetical protein
LKKGVFVIISFASINYLSVLIASVIVIGLGILWYSPILFGNIWVKLQSLKKEEVKGLSSLSFINVLLSALVGTLVIALLLTIRDETTVVHALIISILVGIFTSAKIGMNHIFESRPLGYYFITIGYHLFSCIITGLILGFM